MEAQNVAKLSDEKRAQLSEGARCCARDSGVVAVSVTNGEGCRTNLCAAVGC